MASKTRDELIVDAYRKIGIPGDVGTITAAMETAGENAIGVLIDHFQARHGMPIWKTTTTEFDFSTFTSGQLVIGAGQAGDTTTRVLKVINAWRVDNTVAATPVKTPMQMYERERWHNLTNPAQTGAPNILFSDIRKETIELNVWPKPDSYWAAANGGAIAVTMIKEFTDFADDTAELDFPDHWSEPVIYTLAERLCPEYGVDIAKWRELRGISEQLIKQAMEADNEVGSIYINPSRNW